MPALVPLNADRLLEVHFVDMGQGDGIWIHTYHDGIDGNGVFEGQNIVIDGGPDASDKKNQMFRYLREHAHKDAIIDTLIVTHPHDDHFPGAEGLLRHFEIRSYYDPGYPKGGSSYPSFLEEVRQETADGKPSKIMIGKENFEPLDWGEELQAEILYSYPGAPSGLGSGNTLENNASIVLRLTYGKESFLFMGDGEGKGRTDPPDKVKYVEKILLDTVPREKLKATVLKIAHHGSESSSTLPFIEAVDPEIVVVSSGREPFGGTYIPDASTLRRYCCHNSSIRIYRTDQNDEAEHRDVTNDADGDRPSPRR